MNKLNLKLLSSLEKVFLTKEPTIEITNDDLVCLKNETLSFQIGYMADETGWAQYILGRVDIRSAITDKIKVRRVEQVPVTCPTNGQHDDNYISTEPGLYPDVLVDAPDNRVQMLKSKWSSLWVDIEIDKDMLAGEYEVDFAFQRRLHQKRDSGFEDIAVISVKIKVLDAELPKLDVCHTEWFHYDCLANYYDEEVFSDRFFSIFENYLRIYKKHNINMLLTPLFTPPLDTDVGGERRTVQLIGVTYDADEDKYTFDFNLFRRFIGLCESIGIEFYEMSHLYTQWGAKHAVKVMAEIKKDGIVREKLERIFGWETSATSDGYKRFLREFLVELVAELKGLGIEKRTYFHISDEPSLDHLEDYIAAKTQIIDIIKGFPIIDALSNYEFYETGALAKPIPSNNKVHDFIGGGVQGLWTYYCVSQSRGVANRFIAQPAANSRILGIQLYKYGIEGFLHWGFNFFNSVYSLEPINPFLENAAFHAFLAGDPFIVYPGVGGMPLGSTRLMVMNALMQDVMAFKLLERLTSKEHVLGIIEKGLDTEGITFTAYPRDAEYQHRVRRDVYKEIELYI